MQAVIDRFEQYAPASVMARMALEQALPARWVNEVFEANRQRQYPRELMFSTIVDLMTLVTPGLRPSVHAAARKRNNKLPVSMAALYDKLKRTEPAVLRGLVRGSAQRLQATAAQFSVQASLPGWQLRIVDGKHLPASEKPLQALREHRGAALPGHSLVVYDPDTGLVCDIVPCEDAHESERVGVQPLVQSAQPAQLWIADRHFCTHAILHGLSQTGANFIVREHARHPRLMEQGEWSATSRTDTGCVREQAICIQALDDAQTPAPAWRCIEIKLDNPTEAGDATIRLWSNLPATVDAATIAALYRTRWRIEGMFQRLESVLHSEIHSLGHPRAALLGFAVAVMAYNVLSLLQRAVEWAHREEHPQLQVSTYHLAWHVKCGYEGMLIAVPHERWSTPRAPNTEPLADTLLRLGRRILPRQVATSKRGPKLVKPKGYVDGSLARAQVSTARVLKEARKARP